MPNDPTPPLTDPLTPAEAQEARRVMALDTRPVDLDEIERLCEQATPPPWEHSWAGYVDAPHVGVVTRLSFRRIEDARFTAAAREAVPKLIAAVRERDAEIARLRAALKIGMDALQNILDFESPKPETVADDALTQISVIEGIDAALRPDVAGEGE